MKREELDQLAEFYSLTHAGTQTLLAAPGVSRSRQEAQRFVAQCLLYAAILSLAAALVFFVAANWSTLSVLGRFALVELVLVITALIGAMRQPPELLGRAALLLAFIATGALLALFGQTYQTGADIYELFFMWALLGLPLAWLAQWSVASAAWVLVLNTSLLLFCGLHPTGGLLWVIFNGSSVPLGYLVLAVAFGELALWFLLQWLEIEVAPGWVRRLILTFGFLFLTWAGVLVVVQGDSLSSLTDRPVWQAPILLGVAVAMATVCSHALRRREDIFPLAAALGSFIVITLCGLARVMQFDDMGTFFLLALWLIVSSTVGGRLLTSTARRWREGLA